LKGLIPVGLFRKKEKVLLEKIKNDTNDNINARKKQKPSYENNLTQF